MANNKTRPVWRLIQADYLASDLTLNQICERHDISPSTLKRYGRAHRWPSRKEVKQSGRTGLIFRLFALLEKQILLIEKAKTDMTSEKEVALLGNLARTLEKLIEIETKQKTPSTSENKPGKEMAELRSKLSERIKNLDQC